MDPDANLKEQLQLAAALEDVDYDQLDENSKEAAISDACRLAELVLALDEWISKGGFLPKLWSR